MHHLLLGRAHSGNEVLVATHLHEEHELRKARGLEPRNQGG